MSYNRILCPECHLDFGQEAKFISHLSEKHGIDEVISYYNSINFEGNHPTCRCSPDCKKKLLWAGWKKGYTSKYARGHNARIDSVYLNPDRQIEFAQKRKEGYSSGKYSAWTTGLNKFSDKRIKNMSEKISRSLREGYLSGAIQDWRIKDKNKARVASQKMSETKKKKFSEGVLIPWNKDKTKFDDPRIASISSGISENYKENPDSSYKRLSPEDLVSRVSEFSNFKLLTDPKDYRNKYQRLEFECLLCGEKQIKSLSMITSSPVCFSCAPKESKGQIELFDFVRSLKPDAILSDRSVISPKELDVYIPSAQLGIEYNGLYWHSIQVLKNKSYHESKLNACLSSGIELLSIYEDEWRDKKNIIEGMIKHRLGLDQKKWDARKLKVSTLTEDESSDFFNKNHLEGHVNSQITFGLKDPNTGIILAAMSLRRPFHRKHSMFFECGRCCVLIGHSVRGWLGKLTSIAKNYAKQSKKLGLMTYVDGRIGRGRGYESAGWKIDSFTKSERFWWTDFKNRHNRFKYKADRKNGLSQIEVAEKAGMTLIWGCKNYLYKIEF